MPRARGRRCPARQSRRPGARDARHRLHPRLELEPRVLPHPRRRPLASHAMRREERQLRSRRPRPLARGRQGLSAMVRGEESAHPGAGARGDVHDARGTPRRAAMGQARQLHGPRSGRLSEGHPHPLRRPALARLRPHRARGGPHRRPHPRGLRRCQPRVDRERGGRPPQPARVARGNPPVLPKRFRPAPCTGSRRGAKDSAAAKIWRGL